ncbi:MAG: class I SAM-dependent methyltransferase, partial [Caldilineaceae bacterium]|nr:class I SAM-dependent methyltransferase [Caldilineaceae bacterium]
MTADAFDRFARFYDLDYREYEDDLPMVMELAQEVEGPLLELGCGTGRVLAPLAAAGHRITGLDLSP